MKRKLQEYENAFKKLSTVNSETENKVQILKQECERLNTLAEKRAQ